MNAQKQVREHKIGWFAIISGLFALFILPGALFAKLVPVRDPRAGLLDASLIVLVEQAAKDQFQIKEVFLGEAYPGVVINLPEFKLFTYHEHGPDTFEPITPDTRILLFLKHKEKDLKAWEITAYGYCFFWVPYADKADDLWGNNFNRTDSSWIHSIAKIDDLRKMAADAVTLRRSWEAARDELNEKSRIESLWPYLWNNNRYFFRQTESELKKVGPAAGDYIGREFDSMTHNQRMSLVVDIADYRSKTARTVLLKHLKTLQQTYETWIETKAPGAKEPLDNWNTATEEIKDIYGELYYGLAGLAKFKDQRDLPYIRGLASWAVRYRFKQTCDAALVAFALMPDRANLPIINSIWSEFSTREIRGSELRPPDVVRALLAHTNYTETVPLLAPFLNDDFSKNTVHEALKKITGVDKGDDANAWLKWYKAR